MRILLACVTSASRLVSWAGRVGGVMGHEFGRDALLWSWGCIGLALWGELGKGPRWRGRVGHLVLSWPSGLVLGWLRVLAGGCGFVRNCAVVSGALWGVALRVLARLCGNLRVGSRGF